jgi:hypothetical protein
VYQICLVLRIFLLPSHFGYSDYDTCTQVSSVESAPATLQRPEARAALSGVPPMTNPIRARTAKPDRPKDFPLFAHANGSWA